MDDDVDMLERLEGRLRGMKATVKRRTVNADIDSLLVKVETRDGTYAFATETLLALTDKCSRRYDYLIIDYAYTSPERQASQWNEGRGHAERLESSDHLLTVPQLKAQLLAFDTARGGPNQRKIERFFNRKLRVLMRSFQHDRKNDSVGPYSARAEATRGVFPNCTGLDELDGFSMVYGSEPELREKFYQGAKDGRRLYRYAASAITVRFYQAALEHHLATKAGRLILTRSAFSISAFVVAVAALSSVVQAMVGPLVTEVAAGAWGSAAILAASTGVGVFVGSLGVAWLADRGARGLIDASGQDQDD